MPEDPKDNQRSRAFRPLGGIGGRAAAATLRPFTDAAAVELEALLATALDSESVQRGLRSAFESDGGKQLVADFFDSGLFDEFVDRLLASPSLWRLIDEVADSPAVTAAISQQGLGFADQVGEEVRRRTRRADDWLERLAHRLIRRRNPS
ncbi:MAG TPA: hypothetical protein VGF81_12770 [Solirubrobacteraceae bacterium]|jgi:hypothetical protein